MDMDSKIDMSLDEIIKIDRKLMREQRKSSGGTAKQGKASRGGGRQGTTARGARRGRSARGGARQGVTARGAARQGTGPTASRGKKREARGGGNQQPAKLRRKPQNTAATKVRQYRGQIGGNKYVGGATPQGNKRKVSAAQQKAALLKKKARQAQKVGKQRIAGVKRRQNQQQTGQQARKQRLQAKTLIIKDARELIVNQRRGLQTQGQTRGRGRGRGGQLRGGRGRGRGQGAVRINRQTQQVTAGQNVVQGQGQRRRWRGGRGGLSGQQQQSPGMLTMTIANPIAGNKPKPVKIYRNKNLKQPQARPQTGKVASLSDRFGRIQHLKNAVTGNQARRGAPQRGGRGRRGRGGGRPNAGPTDRTVVIL